MDSEWHPIRVDGVTNFYQVYLDDTSTRQQIFSPKSVADQRTLRAPAYLGTHFDPKINNKNPWQEYHVLSGGDDNVGFFEVAVDLQYRLWAVTHTSGPNIGNNWLATGWKSVTKQRVSDSTLTHLPLPTISHLPLLPEFHKVDKEWISNGTFGKVHGSGKNQQHMNFPEVGLMIQNMKNFVEDCQQEPFIRVFNTYGMSKFEVQEMANRKWSNKNDESIVMRTASFGHGRRDVDMCIREGAIAGDETEGEQRTGVSERLMVPFAVMATYRMRVIETGLRDRCSILR